MFLESIIFAVKSPEWVGGDRTFIAGLVKKEKMVTVWGPTVLLLAL